MIGQTLLHYRILEPLGRGGMGEVYLAEDTALERKVALKVLPEQTCCDVERLARFQREAKALAALNHPHIVTIYSVEEADGVHFMTMELIDGKTLEQLAREGSFTPARILEIAIPLAEALAAAHERGVTHRDLKPANVMLARDGRLKVLDFGLARVEPPPGEGADPEALTLTLTRSGTISGTLPYMSPEQLGEGTPDHRADLFAFGVLLYELAAGRRPFGGDSFAETVSSILRDAPRPLLELNPSFPRSLAQIIERCLQKDPARRFASAPELRAALDAVEPPDAADATDVSASIAVLPFDDLSAERDQGHFCDGIAEEVLGSLNRLDGARVVSRTASFQAKAAGLDLADIGRRLGVAHLLAGSVRKIGSRLRITVQLIAAADGSQLWSERYDRQMEDVFAIQDDIAERTVEALQLTLTPRESATLHKRYTENAEAYDCYLRGRTYFLRFGSRNMEQALRMMKRAIELDLEYALAYAGLADCHSTVYLYSKRSEETREAAEAASLKAIELDPELPEAHAARGLALTLQARHEEAHAEFREAARLNPRLFEAYYLHARDLVALGRYEEAAALFERAAAVRPDDYQSLCVLPNVYRSLGRTADMMSAYRRGLARVERQLEADPEDSRATYLGAVALYALGEKERAMEWARRALELDPNEAAVLYNVACLYSIAGMVDEALDLLEKAQLPGLANKGQLEHDSDFDPIRDHPRFRAIIESFGETDGGG